MVEPSRAAELAAGVPAGGCSRVADPLGGAAVAGPAWRRELGCPVVGITGSTGKTSVKDITRALLPCARPRQPGELQHRDRPAADDPRRAARDRASSCSRWRCAGLGQIAELCEIAEPDVGAITNVGPVHLELLGTLEAIAEAKAEILARARRRRRRRRSRPTPRRSSRTSPPELETITFGARRRRLRARLTSLDGDGMRADDRHAARRGRVRARLRRAAQPRQRALRGRDRRRARASSLGEMAARTAAHILLAAARRADRAARGLRAGQRLLQRQPDLDARGARQPRLARGRRAADRGPRRDGGARAATAAELPPRGRRARPRARDRPRSSASASSPATTRPTSGRRPRAAAVPLVARAARRGRRGPRQGLARRSGSRPSPRRSSTRRSRRGRPDRGLVRHRRDRRRAQIDRGEVLIAGMAAMLITIFLGPKFIEFLRVREFGQQIREEGPQEHHAKAGTPTMGGLILFLAIAVPYLVLSKRDTASLAVFGVALGCAAARLRRRLHQDLQAPLARALGALQAARPDRARAGALVGRLRHARARPGARVADLRRPASTSARCSTCSSSSW